MPVVLLDEAVKVSRALLQFFDGFAAQAVACETLSDLFSLQHPNGALGMVTTLIRVALDGKPNALLFDNFPENTRAARFDLPVTRRVGSKARGPDIFLELG